MRRRLNPLSVSLHKCSANGRSNTKNTKVSILFCLTIKNSIPTSLVGSHNLLDFSVVPAADNFNNGLLISAHSLHGLVQLLAHVIDWGIHQTNNDIFKFSTELALQVLNQVLWESNGQQLNSDYKNFYDFFTLPYSLVNASLICCLWLFDLWQRISMITCSSVPNPFMAPRRRVASSTALKLGDGRTVASG